MNNPLGLGIKSLAEFCAADCEYDGDFAAAFNANSPDGVKCVAFRRMDKNPNYADCIDKCAYCAEGISPFDVQEILARDSIIITDKRGRTVDIRPRIFELEIRDGKHYFTLGCGANNLRPDLFCEFLESAYGGSTTQLIKLESYGEYTF